MPDIALIETGNGGDLVLAGNDLAAAPGLENLPYLAMFGGSDWWGNSLLLGGQTEAAFLSRTETALLQYPLNSAGRIRIEEAVRADLAHLSAVQPGASVEILTAIRADDWLDVRVRVSGRQFLYQWNPQQGLKPV